MVGDFVDEPVDEEQHDQKRGGEDPYYGEEDFEEEHYDNNISQQGKCTALL